MAERKMLAIDLGASSGRGIVGAFDGERLTLRENHRFSNDPVNLCGRLYWDILRIFHEIKLSVQKTVLDGDAVSSIGIDTWGVDYGLLDRAGRLLSNPVHYRDTRTEGRRSWSAARFRQRSCTGLPAFRRSTSTPFTSWQWSGRKPPKSWHRRSGC